MTWPRGRLRLLRYWLRRMGTFRAPCATPYSNAPEICSVLWRPDCAWVFSTLHPLHRLGTATTGSCVLAHFDLGPSEWLENSMLPLIVRGRPSRSRAKCCRTACSNTMSYAFARLPLSLALIGERMQSRSWVRFAARCSHYLIARSKPSAPWNSRWPNSLQGRETAQGSLLWKPLCWPGA